MSSLALEIDLALQRLDPPKASRLERLLRDGLALALGDETMEVPAPSSAASSRRELFARRFAPLNAVPDRDLSDIVNENRGEAWSDGQDASCLGEELEILSGMIADIDTLFAEALALSDDSRLQLVERLLPTIQSEPALEADQLQEVQRRMDDVRSGRVKTISGEQVFREIEQSLSARRKA